MGTNRVVRKGALVGLVFGLAAAGGVAVALATTSGSTDPAPLLSTTRLRGFAESLPVVTASDIGLGEGPAALLGSAPLHLAATQGDTTGYFAEAPDGQLCVVAVSAGATAMTCGAVDLVGRGGITLRTQNRPTDPAIFVGLAANDLSTVSVDGAAGTVAHNVFIAVGRPTSDTYVLTRADGRRASVDMNVNP